MAVAVSLTTLLISVITACPPNFPAVLLHMHHSHAVPNFPRRRCGPRCARAVVSLGPGP